MVLVARSELELKEAFGIILRNDSEVGLILNEAKTKCQRMSTSENRRSVDVVRILNFTFETVPSFVYLSFPLFNRNVISREIDNRIMAGSRAYLTSQTSDAI